MADVELRWIRPGVVGILKVTYGEPDNGGVDTYPVIAAEPANLVSYGPIYESGEWRIATGTRNVNGDVRPVAWPVKPEEEAKINKIFADAMLGAAVPLEVTI